MHTWNTGHHVRQTSPPVPRSAYIFISYKDPADDHRSLRAWLKACALKVKASMKQVKASHIQAVQQQLHTQDKYHAQVQISISTLCFLYYSPACSKFRSLGSKISRITATCVYSTGFSILHSENISKPAYNMRWTYIGFAADTFWLWNTYLVQRISVELKKESHETAFWFLLNSSKKQRYWS